MFQLAVFVILLSFCDFEFADFTTIEKILFIGSSVSLVGLISDKTLFIEEFISPISTFMLFTVVGILLSGDEESCVVMSKFM